MSERRRFSTKRSRAKGARPELPQTGKKFGWRDVLYALGILIFVGATVIAMQFLLGYIMILFLGEETVEEALWTSIYSALVYLLSMLVIILVPVGIKKQHEKMAKKSAAKIKTEKVKNNSNKATDDSKLAINDLRTVSEKATNSSKLLSKKSIKNAVKITTSKFFDKNELGLGEWPSWADILLAPVGFFVYLLIASVLVALFSLFPWFDASESQSLIFDISLSGFDRLLAFFSLVVVAPVAEEIIFRGWLYGRLRQKFFKKMPNIVGMILAIFLVSLLFGIIHLQWNVGVNVFAMSIVLCALREITGTIHAGILLHILKNGIAFYLVYILGM